MEFKIISEAIVYLSCPDELYLMLIKKRNDYFIEVDSRTARVGKRQVRSRREGDVVFEQMTNSLNKYEDVCLVLGLLELSFKMLTIREHMFIINNLYMELPFNEIWKLKRIYHCETTPIICDLIFEDPVFERTIHITFPGREAPIGFFRAANENAMFSFYLNQEYLEKI